MEDTALWVELPFAKRTGVDVRAGNQCESRHRRNSMAQRPGGQVFEHQRRPDGHGGGREGNRDYTSLRNAGEICKVKGIISSWTRNGRFFSDLCVGCG